MSDEAQDDALLAELRQLASRFDPVPPALLHGAREALTWLRVDAELAELLSDSALEHRQPALARAAGGSRLLAFESHGLTIELEVLEEGAKRRLVGQLSPPSAATIELQTETGRESVPADELGRFRTGELMVGRLRLRVTVAGRDGPAVETSWITI